MTESNTPYDDVFKTLLNDCSELIIPVINEVFGENYVGNEQIIFSQNEHFLNQQEGNENKRITDSSFRIIGKVTKKYHVECQSTPDSSMLIRFFEYDAQIALDDGEINENVLTVSFPHSAVLFLRYNLNTPDTMQIRILTPKGEISYQIPIMKTQRYTIEEIFEKKLLFLIPFYIFSHESRFAEYERDNDRLLEIISEYKTIKQRLDKLEEMEEIEVYTKCIICDMTKRVIRSIARSNKKLKEGVESVMGGKILEHEAKTILNKGISRGKKEGIIEGKIEGKKEGKKEGELNMLTAIRMMKENKSFSVISEVTGLSTKRLSELQAIL